MKKTIVAALLALSFAAPAFAGPGDNPRRRVDFYDNAGTLHEMDNFDDAAKVAMFEQHAKKLPPGTIVMTADGSIYVLEDYKMPNGQMMSDALMH
jgi:hypothetical protein